MKENIAHKIKHRIHANDEFPTPIELVKVLITLVPISGIVMDNAYGTGNWFNHLPKPKLKSEDFFNDHRKVDWYITNPPYSMLDKWLLKSCDAEKGFAYLLGLHNLTPRRIELLEQKGFFITHIHICKVFRWFGISAFIIWEKNAKPIINYNRIVWHESMNHLSDKK